MKAKLDQAFNQFIESSSRLSSETPLSALTDQVARLTNLVNQKNNRLPLTDASKLPLWDITASLKNLNCTVSGKAL